MTTKNALQQRKKRAKHRVGDDEPYCLYSLRDISGVPRYIGISRRLQNRLKSHARKYPEWFPVVLMTGIHPLEAFGLEADLQERLGLNHQRSGGLKSAPHRLKSYREYREWIDTRSANNPRV